MADVKRSKVCAVCGDISDTFHLNYNACACLSCRAFFRRIVNKSKVRTAPDGSRGFGAYLACKRSGASGVQCEITVKTRIKCQRCRFERCMEAGMDPACVLDDDKKKNRFRKLIKKRQQVYYQHQENILNECGLEVVEPPIDLQKLLKRKNSKPSKKTMMAEMTEERSFCSEQRPLDIRLQSWSKMEHITHSSAAFPDPFAIRSWHQPEHAVSAEDFQRMEDAYEDDETLGKRLALKLKSVLAHRYTSTSQGAVDYSAAAASTHAVAEEAIGAADVSAVAMRDYCMDQRMVQIRDNLYRAWWSACDKVKQDRSFYESLFSLHMRGVAPTKTQLRRQVVAVAEVFVAFAMAQREVATLAAEAQRAILRRATPLFVQYILARYLHADGGNQQLRWMLLDTRKVLDVVDLPPVCFDELNRNVKLFSEGFDTDMYIQHSRRVCKAALTPEDNAMVAIVCLFDSSVPPLKYADVGTLEARTVDLYSFIEWSQQAFGTASKYTFASLVENLQAMATFFDTTVNWSDDSCAPPTARAELSLVGTLEDELWISRQFQKFDSAFSSIQLNREVSEEFINLAFNRPVSVNVIPRAFRLWTERFSRILQSHDEFAQLAARDQQTLQRTTAMQAVALATVRHHAVADIQQQMQFSLALSEELFNERFATIRDNMLRQSTTGTVDFVRGDSRFDLLAQRYDQLALGLTCFARDFDLYRLVTLIALFTCNTTSCTFTNPAVVNLRNTYTRILRRRLVQMYGPAVAEDIYARFTASICDLREMAYFVKVMTEMPTVPPKVAVVAHST